MLKFQSANVSLSKQVSNEAIDAAAKLAAVEFVSNSFFYECIQELGCQLVDPKHGKLTKRLVKLAKRKFGYIISDALAGKIGKLFAESATGKTLHVSILSDTCFEPGIFGDHDACFFTEVGTHYRASLDSAGAQAVCFFEDGLPIARCWLYYDEYSDSHIVFNLYVAQFKALSLAQAAEAIATALEKKYVKKTSLQWSEVYINSNQCFVLSDKSIESDCMYIHSQSARPGDYVSCRNCGELVPEFESNCSFCNKIVGKICLSCRNPLHEHDMIHHDGEAYCWDCFHDLFFTCECCGDIVGREYERYIEGYGSYCESCYGDRFRYCVECSEDHHRDDCTELDNGNYVCDDCLKRWYFECSECNDYHHIDNQNEYEEELYCNRCFNKHFRICLDCGDVILIEDAVELEDVWLCERCSNNRNQINLFVEGA